ncbi:hypothetical protein [Alkalibacillus haloalkaliphilus]|uniref:Lipoprotein n=1 Tax=Alkalibacillus haloalkaliphilus TaxID=94136 RepID=A0A511W571_9BACI|nr:hypothetical protein [Alkalibacillus haloalkaliphilus]GEN46254.1 hypothetical protein AHA02nite_20300 [Alkalibacillus haloalkaliphilus]
MKKNLYLILILLIVLVGCSQTVEEKYEEATKLLGEGEIEKGSSVVRELDSDYKETQKLIDYVEVYTKYEEHGDNPTDYSPVAKLLNSKFPEGYEGVLKEEVESLREQVITLREGYSIKLLKEVLGNINDEDFEAAKEIIDEHNIKHEDINDIRNFVLSRYYGRQFLKYRDMRYNLKALEYKYAIDPEYDGLFKNTILNHVYFGIEHRDEIKERIESTKENIEVLESMPSDPSIGMTAEEVKESSWGEPREVNKTTTANGVREQWVYYNQRYIYLEDGIVTTIRE